MTAACRHCGGPVPAGTPDGFCCRGCAAAFRLIGDLDLDAYYRQRCLDPAVASPRPEDGFDPGDAAAYVQAAGDGRATLHLLVEGIHCGACVWLIETALARQPGVVAARLSMATRRLTLTWREGETNPEALLRLVATLGYRLVPYDPVLLASADAARDRRLLRALAIAGFAAGNIMMLSVGVWAGDVQGISPGTRDLLHWISALIAVPAIAYAGRPFFSSAAAALRNRRTNMDVPISLAIILTPAVSLVETFTGGAHAYFDGSTMLLFFLLIGRYLDSRTRSRARSAAEQLVALAGRAVTVIDADGRTVSLPPRAVRRGMLALVPAGARLGVDGVVVDGRSELDLSLVTGESTPVPVIAGEAALAGALNLAAPLTLRVTAAGEATVLAEIVRLMEAAEHGRTRYTAIADRAARWYSPVVHAAAALTFAGWMLLGGAGWQPALLNAIAVLIITCPCALALAVPVVQVVAGGRLMRRGILVKSATALERLARIDTVVLDKTGILTLGRLALEPAAVEPEALAVASGMAAASRHPLARALAAAAPAPVAAGVQEVPGCGLALATGAGEVRLGSRAWCRIAEDGKGSSPELWLARPDRTPVRFVLSDRLRPDAAATVDRLQDLGLQVELLSGDRAPAVAEAAAAVGISRWRARCTPADKAARLAELAAEGRRVLMVGDGLNDAPALATAFASMSPASAADISQTAADLVFQGERLGAVVEAIRTARLAGRLARQNLALTFVYNVVTVPLAVLGWVTPLIAAAAMSGSSILVILNALRLGRSARA